jgi:hypothetical protein
MGKAKRKTKTARDTRIAPTPEALAHGNYTSAGMAYRRIPMIDTLRDTGRLNEEQHRRLAHYRDQSAVAETSLTKSCLDIRIAGGRGDTPMSAAVLSAILEVGRIERDLGSLRGITRAIAIDDWTPLKWCCERYGSVQCIDNKGKPFFRSKVPESVAIQELKLAAFRIMA